MVPREWGVTSVPFSISSKEYSIFGGYELEEAKIELTASKERSDVRQEYIFKKERSNGTEYVRMIVDPLSGIIAIVQGRGDSFKRYEHSIDSIVDELSSRGVFVSYIPTADELAEIQRKQEELERERRDRELDAKLDAIEKNLDEKLAAIKADEEARGEIFYDVYTSHPYSKAIKWGKEKKILRGYPDYTFRADNFVSRIEMVKIIVEALGVDLTEAADIEVPFSDVDLTQWYGPHLRYAYWKNIVEGYADNTFRPTDPVNGAEGMKIAYEALGVETENDPTIWYGRYRNHARNKDVLFHRDLDVSKPLTRKDVIWIVWQLQKHRPKIETASTQKKEPAQTDTQSAPMSRREIEEKLYPPTLSPTPPAYAFRANHSPVLLYLLLPLPD